MVPPSLLWLNVAPPSVLIARYVATRVWAASYRPSYHITAMSPVAGSTARVGWNCGRLPSLKLSAGESSLTRVWVGVLVPGMKKFAVAPPTVGVRTVRDSMMSKPGVL